MQFQEMHLDIPDQACQAHVEASNNPRDNVKMFACKMCSYKSPHRRDFNDHCERHENNPKFKVKRCCFVDCDFESFSVNVLADHQTRVHFTHPCYDPEQNRVFREQAETLKGGVARCLMCGIEKSCLLLIEKHVSKVHGEDLGAPLIGCLYCSYKARHTHHLKEHVKVRQNSPLDDE